MPIPRFYAAGEIVGGIFYFNYPGGTGLTSGAVFGRTAGVAAARAALGQLPRNNDQLTAALNGDKFVRPDIADVTP